MPTRDEQVLKLAPEMVKSALFANLLGGTTRNVKRQLREAASSYKTRSADLASRLAEQQERALDAGPLGSLWHRARAGITKGKMGLTDKLYSNRDEFLRKELSKSRRRQLKSGVQVGILGGLSAAAGPKIMERAQEQGIPQQFPYGEWQ